MAKAGLSNQLIGKTVVPKPGYGDVNLASDVNGRVWAGLKPNASGEMIATIDAAWVEEGQIKIAIHDPWGNTAETYLTLVNLKQY